jgi:hypothetical protein
MSAIDDFSPAEVAWNNGGSRLSLGTGVMGRSMGGGGGAPIFNPPHQGQMSDVEIYKQNNALANYLKGEARSEAEYMEKLRAAAQQNYDVSTNAMKKDLFDRQQYADNRKDSLRRERGDAPPGFAGVWPRQGAQQQFTDLDWYKLNMQRNQGNGMGDPGFGGEWKPSQYQNQPNPYQPRATELNNASNNYLARMMGR